MADSGWRIVRGAFILFGVDRRPMENFRHAMEANYLPGTAIYAGPSPIRR
jgi:hypothetical protein